MPLPSLLQSVSVSFPLPAPPPMLLPLPLPRLPSPSPPDPPLLLFPLSPLPAVQREPARRYASGSGVMAVLNPEPS